MFVPNHENAVTMLPRIARRARPRAAMSLPMRAWRVREESRTMSRAPFSFGSQPQKRPHDWSAHMPPVTVPMNEKSRANAVIA